jgi:hypothetical protein
MKPDARGRAELIAIRLGIRTHERRKAYGLGAHLRPRTSINVRGIFPESVTHVLGMLN